MEQFTLQRPVLAAKYRYQFNEQEIADLVGRTGRTGYSFSNVRGYLHIYNNGPELAIEDGSWVVALGGDIAVLDENQFRDLFVMVAPE